MNSKLKIKFAAAVGMSLFSICAAAEPQPAKKIPRIGMVSPDGNAKNPGPQVEAFRQELKNLGYVEGKSVFVEYRFVEGKSDHIPALVAELVRLKVDVLVLRAQPSIRAAKQATRTIPIVMMTTQDPVAAKFIDSLARPGGNITGITTMSRELSGKRLELVKEVIPEIARVGVLLNATQLESDYKWYEAPARALGIQLHPLPVRTPADIDSALKVAVKARVGALIALTGSLLNNQQSHIAELAIKSRLPSFHERNDFVEAGGLMSYSARDVESFRLAAGYVDKILKGARPGDLPVEQPTDFDLVINLKTAKQIGLTIPPNVLARADRVIK
jgi:putative ABC transport system substrate-binding protein